MVITIKQNHEFSIKRGGFHKTLILKNALEDSVQIHGYILIQNIHMNQFQLRNMHHFKIWLYFNFF